MLSVLASRHTHVYKKFPEFNILPEIVWQGLNRPGSAISDMDTLTQGNKDQQRFRDDKVWHRKPQIDEYVEANTKLRFANYKPGKSSNELYKAIATEISLLRKNGYIKDWSAPNIRDGVWRLNAEKLGRYTEAKAKQEMRERNFHADLAKTTIYVRTKQMEFRKILLNQYQKCLFCGFALERYVVAAHIVPYYIMRAKHPDDAMNPIDGLLLCRLCDVAFEHGSIILEPDYEISVGSELENTENKTIESWVENINRRIEIDNDVEYQPSPDYLKEKKLLVGNKSRQEDMGAIGL